MAEKDYGQNFGKDQFDRKQQHSVFDNDVIDDVDLAQEPYPVEDTAERPEAGGAEVENPDAGKRVHEYEDKDYPHEYKPASAIIDDYEGSSGIDLTNDFEQQNPL